MAVATVSALSPAMKRPAYLAIHPLGKVPAIEDGDFVLWETTAILEYLAARHPDGERLLPGAGTRAGALARQWMAYGENPLTVVMGEIAAHGGAMPEPMRVPALVERGEAIASSLVGVVERALEDRPYILGDSFTAADVMLGFGLSIARHLRHVDERTPRVAGYLERLEARPAHRRAASV